MFESDSVLLWVALGALGFCLIGIITAQKRAKQDHERQLEMIQKKIAQREKQAANAASAETKSEDGKEGS